MSRMPAKDRLDVQQEAAAASSSVAAAEHVAPEQAHSADEYTKLVREEIAQREAAQDLAGRRGFWDRILGAIAVG